MVIHITHHQHRDTYTRRLTHLLSPFRDMIPAPPSALHLTFAVWLRQHCPDSNLTAWSLIVHQLRFSSCSACLASLIPHWPKSPAMVCRDWGHGHLPFGLSSITLSFWGCCSTLHHGASESHGKNRTRGWSIVRRSLFFAYWKMHQPTWGPRPEQARGETRRRT